METFKEQINEHLSSFLQKNNRELFEEVFEKMNSKDKTKYRKLFEYIFCILKNTQNKENQLSILNLHIEKRMNPYEKTIVAEFIWQYFFCTNEIEGNSIEENNILVNKIKELTKKVSRPLIIPERDVITQRRIRESRKKNRQYLKFLKKINPKSSLIPRTLINLKTSQQRNLSSLFKYNPAYLSTDELSDLNSFVLHNTNGFNDIKGLLINSTPLLKLIKNIVLFDCENSVQRFSPFNFQQLSNLNEHHGTIFNLFLIVTFSNKENLNSIKTKINRLKERYYIPIQSSYLVTNQEFDYLIEQQHIDSPEISFLGPLSSVFWEEFHLETKINGLYELRSIKMMNVYSLCFNQEMKEYILTHIFSLDLNYSLITEDTRKDILSLPKEDVLNLKDLLSNLLDIIISADMKSSITNIISDDPKIVLDDSILGNKRFLDLVKKSINVRSNRKFINWDNLEKNSANEIIILSYRDQGNFNNHFYPNINEIIVSENTKIKCLLPALFFKENHEWSKYNLTKDYYKTLDHPLRRNHFNWDGLKGKLQNLKPEKTIDISWDLESDYSSSDTRITYRIVFDNNRHSTCNPSDLHIYYEDENKKKRIQPIRWIYENLEIEEDRFFVKRLDELIEEFNPAERLIDTEQQENDLEIIRSHFDLGEESAGRLWKILLARKAADSSVEVLYKDLKTLFDKSNLHIVSLSHFESTWINPDSESLIPRGNKVFKIICNYLELPTTYLRIIYNIKNRNIKGKINATRIYSKLLKDLFNDGCFDEGANPEIILSTKTAYYKDNHNLDELGIDEENPLTSLITLIEFIRPELSFKEVKSIEKREE